MAALLSLPSGDIRVNFIGISCYSSSDLHDWKNEGLVLSASDDPSSDLYKDRVCERPKVIYNKKTKRFVMWMHIDTADYTAARAGVAVSDSPTGPFTYLYSIATNQSDCRDLTIFQDTDDTAYLIHSSDWNKTLRISQLTDDYTGLTGVCTKAFIEQEREASAAFFHEGLYYMLPAPSLIPTSYGIFPISLFTEPDTTSSASAVIGLASMPADTNAIAAMIQHSRTIWANILRLVIPSELNIAISRCLLRIHNLSFIIWNELEHLVTRNLSHRHNKPCRDSLANVRRLRCTGQD